MTMVDQGNAPDVAPKEKKWTSWSVVGMSDGTLRCKRTNVEDEKDAEYRKVPKPVFSPERIQMELQPINDELVIPCAACARKHLSAAIAHYADSLTGELPVYWRTLFARAMINLCEATEGYKSHLPFAVGLFVKAEQECGCPEQRTEIRKFRLTITDGRWGPVPPDIYPPEYDWYRAHVLEAEREYPDIRTAVEREPFYRDNMSEQELRQAEVNYRLAQLRWLDENVFGILPVEKGDKEMATCSKKGCKAACKGGKTAPAKKKATPKKGK